VENMPFRRAMAGLLFGWLSLVRVPHPRKLRKMDPQPPSWAAFLDLGSEGLHMVAIDGRSLRRSYDNNTVKKLLKMLQSVFTWIGANRIVMGCQTVSQSSNEIIAIAELLKKLDLHSAMSTWMRRGGKKGSSDQDRVWRRGIRAGYQGQTTDAGQCHEGVLRCYSRGRVGGKRSKTPPNLRCDTCSTRDPL
jgi:hypothetical protein